MIRGAMKEIKLEYGTEPEVGGVCFYYIEGQG